jgi:hypothetical protein
MTIVFPDFYFPGGLSVPAVLVQVVPSSIRAHVLWRRFLDLNFTPFIILLPLHSILSSHVTSYSPDTSIAPPWHHAKRR